MTEWPIDWRSVVDEAIRRRKEEGLTQRALADLAGVSTPTLNAFEQGEVRLQFERVIAILEALGMFQRPGAPDSFAAFVHKAHRRWGELVAPLPADHPARQPLGHSEQAYELIGLPEVLPPRALKILLSKTPRTSGWPPFWIPTRIDLRPTIEDGLVECWLGRPESDRVFDDAAHSDFWRIDGEGRAYLQRGYQEDGRDSLAPGTFFDLTLPIWRTAEVLLHAAALARLIGGNAETAVSLTTRYTGLEGRGLVSWAQPGLRAGLGEHHRARSARVDLDIITDVGKIETELVSIVDLFLEPLFERFDGYQISTQVVEEQIAALQRQQR